MANLSISELPVLAGPALGATDPLALADLSASETVQITTKTFIESGVQLIDDGAIPFSKIVIGTLPDDSVGTATIQDGAVTAPKLAGQSSGIYQPTDPLPATGAFVGQIAVANNKLSMWSGAAWIAIEAAGSINSITGDETGIVLLSVSQTGDTVSLEATLAPTSQARQFLAGPTATSGDPSYRQIVGLDLPVATNSEQGAVLVNGNGLTMAGNVIQIDNTVTATEGTTTFGVVQYDASGLVTDGRAIGPADLPIATDSSLGAIIPSQAFTVDASGIISITNSVVANTATKVTYDADGLITAGQALQPDDIPPISADLLTSGILSQDRIETHSIERIKMAPYSIAFIQEAAPATTDPSLYAGCLWFQESTAQLRMWNSNAWTAVGFGRLAAENLRWGGLIDAFTGLVTGTTQAGTTAGLQIGQPLPTATDVLGGLYVLVDTPGANINVVPGVTFNAGDWCLCVSEIEGWIRIATTGGGGGGGVNQLGELLDVQLTAPSEGQVLTFDAGSGQWVNADSQGEVASVFGRTGAVVAEEGDYDLDQLGDVVVTNPTLGQVLVFDGAAWANEDTTVDGVQSVTGTLPILITGTPASPDVSINPATTATAGSLSAADKTKLDNATNANTPNTLVMRDANGNFEANVITATDFDLENLPPLPTP